MVAVIFDMDGVIIDSNPLHAEIWLDYLTEQKLPTAGIETWMHGKRNDEIMRRLLGPLATEQEVFNHGANKEALYRKRMAPIVEQQLTPGIRELLEELVDLPMGVGSNAEPQNVEMVLEVAGIARYFQAIVDGHQVKYPKPAPDIYLRVAQLLGVDPAQTVIFEDSPGGIQAARAAGATVVGVQYQGHHLPGSHLTIRDFNDPALRPWLHSLQPPSATCRL